MTGNPYNWQKHTPKILIERPQMETAVDLLRQGGSAYILAGRGMGKSVFLHQIEKEMKARFDVRVIRIASPPLEMTVRGYLKMVARHMRLSEDFMDLRELFDAYFNGPDAASGIVLLFDEYDRYAHPLQAEGNHPGRAFFSNLEAAHRDFESNLGIIAAGGIGVYVFRDVLGSPFISRAEEILLSPFSREDLLKLSSPFHEQGQPLSEEVVDALFLASGGNPALVTYGLQKAWDITQLTARHVGELFSSFQSKHREFIRDIHHSFADPKLSRAPQRVWL
ncbi:MAG: hypothetical protein QNK37_11360 [Acidobacteriota bacterium]|nr:hypothetical protein [Acidobacteriota bacterium]